KRGERGKFQFDGQLIVMELQFGKWVFAGHFDLLNFWPIRSTRGLEQPRGWTRFGEEIKWDLAVAARVEKLPCRELAVDTDFEVSSPNSAQMHSGIGMAIGEITK